MTSHDPVTGALRRALKRAVDAGTSQSEIARAIGAPQPAINRFLHSERGLRLERIDQLANYFGLALVLESTRRGSKR